MWLFSHSKGISNFVDSCAQGESIPSDYRRASHAGAGVTIDEGTIAVLFWTFTSFLLTKPVSSNPEVSYTKFWPHNLESRDSHKT